MALGSGEQQSGGKVIDQDQRQVVAVEGPGGTPITVTTSGGSTDVTDRAARLVGHVTVDSAPTTAVTGTFWQNTQPVSAASLPLPSGAATDSTLTNGNLRVGGTVSVTGTFFQATQPVSLATNTPDVTDRSARLLGHVTVDSAPTTAVTGTFWQATQPVSGTVTATQGTAAASSGAWPAKITDGTNVAAVKAGSTAAVAADTPLVVTVHPTSGPTTTQAVSGTFWQATQPVSGTVTAAQATAASLAATVTQGPAAAASGAWTAKVTDGTNTAAVKAASTAAAAADPSLVVAIHPTSPLPAGSNALGTVTAAQATASSLNATVTQQTLTKGTQGATGVSVQDLKDAGRALVTYYMVIPVLATATDTLQSLTGTKGAATVTATTTPAVVTTGKTFRIQSFSAVYIATATSGYGVARLRYNTGGVVAITSPVLATLVTGSDTPATANAGSGAVSMPLPDGLEVSAGTGIGISVQGFAAAVATAVGFVHCSVSGYEY